jgi:hypothetical protein
VRTYLASILELAVGVEPLLSELLVVLIPVYHQSLVMIICLPITLQCHGPKQDTTCTRDLPRKQLIGGCNCGNVTLLPPNGALFAAKVMGNIFEGGLSCANDSQPILFIDHQPMRPLLLLLALARHCTRCAMTGRSGGCLQGVNPKIKQERIVSFDLCESRRSSSSSSSSGGGSVALAAAPAFRAAACTETGALPPARLCPQQGDCSCGT